MSSSNQLPEVVVGFAGPRHPRRILCLQGWYEDEKVTILSIFPEIAHFVGMVLKLGTH